MSSGRLARRLAAILAADVVGYSRLMGDDEAGTLVRLNALRNEVIDPAVALHRGRFFKTTGDGLLIEFASVVDAIESAVAVQHAIAAREAAVADDRRIVLRIGINLGDVIVEGDDIHGDGVNVAARLEAAADPGGVLISQIVHDSVAGKLDIAFHDSGERAFKNIANPIRVWSWPEKLTRVAAAGLEAARDAKPLIMVGAFEARREEEAELAQGLRDELATAFSRLTGLVVTDDPAAARYVVRGGVRLAGSRCRIWGATAEREHAAMFSPRSHFEGRAQYPCARCAQAAPVVHNTRARKRPHHRHRRRRLSDSSGGLRTRRRVRDLCAG